MSAGSERRPPELHARPTSLLLELREIASASGARWVVQFAAGQLDGSSEDVSDSLCGEISRTGRAERIMTDMLACLLACLRTQRSCIRDGGPLEERSTGARASDGCGWRGPKIRKGGTSQTDWNMGGGSYLASFFCLADIQEGHVFQSSQKRRFRTRKPVRPRPMVIRKFSDNMYYSIQYI